MRAIIQRCDEAQVIADGKITGKIVGGLFVLLGVQNDDTTADADILAAKVANLRIFCDSQDKMNLSVLDVSKEILVVSNFTLCADTKKGNRPSFIGAMKPPESEHMYEYFMDALVKNGVKKVAGGKFGADMEIDAKLCGPITITLDSIQWRK